MAPTRFASDMVLGAFQAPEGDHFPDFTSRGGAPAPSVQPSQLTLSNNGYEERSGLCGIPFTQCRRGLMHIQCIVARHHAYNWQAGRT